jgi:hypothetical protein
MSYCRFSDGKYGKLDEPSDVYMYPGNLIECVGCNVGFNKRSDALNHLKNHIKIGDRVPKYALDRLEKEIEEIGDEYF